MPYNKSPLSFKQQLDLLKSRGLMINNEKKSLKLLENIGYYKIKEFLKPYEKFRIVGGDKELYYEKISFETIIKRFYQDKNIRIYLLHAIEKIELSIKTQFAYVLGNRDGFRYLQFKNWCNKEEYCKHYLKIKEEEFKLMLKKSLERNTSESIKEFRRLDETKEFPPIWMVVDILTLGEIIHLFSIMSNRNKEIISKKYRCTSKEFESWIKHIRFIRNKCAHNANIIDLKINTKPKLKSEWNDILYFYEKEEKRISTDRIANTFLVTHYLVNQINNDYDFKNLHTALKELVEESDEISNKLGFKSSESINIFFKERKEF